MTEDAADARLDRRPPALGCSLRNACSSGKPRVTIAPSTATGRQATISGLVGGWALSWATMAGQAASSCSSSGSAAAGSSAVGGRLRAAASGRVGRRGGRSAVGRGASGAVRRARAASARASSARRVVGVGCGCRCRRGRGCRGLGVAGVAVPRVDRSARRVAPASRRSGLGGGVPGGVAGSGFAAGRCAAGDGAAEPVGTEPASLDDGAPGANIASSSWKRRPPMPARFGSIAASRRPAAARAAGSWRTAAGSARPAISSARIASTAWSSSARTSRPRSSSVVEEGDAGRAVAADEVIDERVHDLGVGQAEQVADGRLVDPLGRGRQELVEHRLRVAHAAGGQPGDEVDRGRHRRPGRRPRGSGRACPRSRRRSGGGRRTAGGATGWPAGSPTARSRRT